jgi:hypothetical protein
VETPSPNSRFTDIVEAIAHSQADMAGVSLDAFEADWRRRWVVERGIEIIAEASRRLPDEPRSRPGSPSTRGRGMKARATRRSHGGKSPTSATSCLTTISGPLPTCCGAWCMTICRLWIACAGRN